jgi:hypothetical protein
MILLFAGHLCNAQSRNNFSLVYAITSTSTATTGTHDDDEHYNYNYNYTVTSGPRFGLAYSHYIFKWFAVETDVLYMRNNATLYETYNNTILHNTVELVSLQGFVKISFLKYLYVDGGIAADCDPSSNINDKLWDQAGVAAEAGFGAKISLKRITFSINPYVRTHGDLVFGKVDSNDKLNERSIKFAVGYDF